uniref:von Willebrand factor A domain containing 5B1 n=1 Tax=Meleagris gallopavo TaxID=9103 RepID=A0A803Y1A9_MELGA
MAAIPSSCRLTLQKTRLLTRAAKGFMSKSPGRASEASSESDIESADYLPLVSSSALGRGPLGRPALCQEVHFGMGISTFPAQHAYGWYLRASCFSSQVSLQLACGAFLMNSAFCKAVSIPMEKLCWTSPFSCHRLALSPSSSSSTKRPEQRGSPGHTEQRDASISEADSTDVQMLLLDIELQKQTEPEGMLWATAVALAWLEHSSASHFTEWELVAAKASLWLGEQDFPQGCSLAAVKSAAQQLFVLLRHWDENLEFNLLCYNPGSV